MKDELCGRCADPFNAEKAHLCPQGVFNPNKELNEAFEEQRIHDLKIDIDSVAEEVKNSYNDCDGEAYPDCGGCRMHRLYQDLMWFKELL